MFQQRTASVKSIEIKSLALASVLQIGDSQIIESLSKALALHRETELFFGNEGDLNKFPIFSEPIPLPPVYERVNMYRENMNPYLKVGNIDILGVSSSATVHLGNTRHVSLESRTKHIRQLLSRD